MRLRTDIFVSALTRRVFSAGGFAAVERRGAEEAGAIFIRHRQRDGREDLFGPAPQMLVEESGERRFERRLAAVDRETVDRLLERESRFDGDLWIVELEIDTVADLFALAKDGT